MLNPVNIPDIVNMASIAVNTKWGNWLTNMFRDTCLWETMDHLFTDNWQDALTRLLAVKLKGKTRFMTAAWWNNIPTFFSDYAANLGVSALPKKAVSQLENDNAGNTQWSSESCNTQSASQYLMTAYDN